MAKRRRQPGRAARSDTIPKLDYGGPDLAARPYVGWHAERRSDQRPAIMAAMSTAIFSVCRSAQSSAVPVAATPAQPSVLIDPNTARAAAA